MFNDALYYITILLQGKSYVLLVKYMNTDEFVDEFVKRFGETPKIANMLTISDNEFDNISEYIKNPELIFEGVDA